MNRLVTSLVLILYSYSLEDGRLTVWFDDDPPSLNCTAEVIAGARLMLDCDERFGSGLYLAEAGNGS